MVCKTLWWAKARLTLAKQATALVPLNYSGSEGSTYNVCQLVCVIFFENMLKYNIN